MADILTLAQPTVEHLQQLASGWGILEIRVDGLLATDTPKQAVFAAQPRSGGGASLEKTITPTANDDGVLEAIPGNSRARLLKFTITPADLATVASNAGGYEYAVRFFFERDGATYYRDVQTGKFGARAAIADKTTLDTAVSLAITGTASGTVGQTDQLTATVLDVDGDPVVGATVTWSSSNTNVATVDATGLVEYVAPGTATITASCQSVSDTATATCTDPAFTSPTTGDLMQYDGTRFVPVDPETRFYTQAQVDTLLETADASTRAVEVRQLLATFTPPQLRDVVLFREDRGAIPAYWLGQHIGDGRYWCAELLQYTGSGENLYRLFHSHVRIPAIRVLHTDAAITYTGTFTTVVDANSIAGSYRRSTTAGAKVEWTTPADSTVAGMVFFGTTNAGIAKVSIDGDATRARNLPTAQELVDAGTLASTALVSGGGTLNPTDRVLDQYRAVGATSFGVNSHKLFADDLAPGAHTISVERTGYTNPASTDTRLYAVALYSATADTRPASSATPSVVLVPEDYIFASSSVWEMAVQVAPSGQSSSDFVGGGHGYEYQSGFTLAVDSVTTTLANGAMAVGNVVTVSRPSELRHPGMGSTAIASIATTYTMARGTGLTVASVITWNVAGTMPLAYLAMMPVGEDMDIGGLVGASADYDLSVNPTVGSDLAHGNIASPAAYAWEPDGRYAALLHLPAVATAMNDWTYAAPDYAFWQDRVSSDINKAYFTRSSSTSSESFTASSVWTVARNYRVARLAHANDLLARHE